MSRCLANLLLATAGVLVACGAAKPTTTTTTTTKTKAKPAEPPCTKADDVASTIKAAMCHARRGSLGGFEELVVVTGAVELQLPWLLRALVEHGPTTDAVANDMQQHCDQKKSVCHVLVGLSDRKNAPLVHFVVTKRGKGFTISDVGWADATEKAIPRSELHMMLLSVSSLPDAMAPYAEHKVSSFAAVRDGSKLASTLLPLDAPFAKLKKSCATDEFGPDFSDPNEGFADDQRCTRLVQVCGVMDGQGTAPFFGYLCIDQATPPLSIKLTGY